MSNLKDLRRWLLQDEWRFHSIKVQRGQGFYAFAQNIRRTAMPFLCRYVVPAAERIRADLLEFSAPELAEVVSG